MDGWMGGRGGWAGGRADGRTDGQTDRQTPGGGTLIFSAYVGSDPASALHPQKNIRNFKHPKKIFEISATQKNIQSSVP